MWYVVAIACLAMGLLLVSMRRRSRYLLIHFLYIAKVPLYITEVTIEPATCIAAYQPPPLR